MSCPTKPQIFGRGKTLSDTSKHAFQVIWTYPKWIFSIFDSIKVMMEWGGRKGEKVIGTLYTAYCTCFWVSEMDLLVVAILNNQWLKRRVVVCACNKLTTLSTSTTNIYIYLNTRYSLYNSTVHYSGTPNNPVPFQYKKRAGFMILYCINIV